jgi:hypothetical protein
MIRIVVKTEEIEEDGSFFIRKQLSDGTAVYFHKNGQKIDETYVKKTEEGYQKLKTEGKI